MGSRYAIEADELRHTYRVRTGWWRPRHIEVEAVCGVSLTVGRGELFGLLGPDGAGKTTIIRMLSALLVPSSGNAWVAGHDLRTQPREVRRRIGYVVGGDRGLSALDNLRHFAEPDGVPPRGLPRRPEVLFLDEPSIGAGPVDARELRRTIAGLTTTGTTVVLATRHIAEAYELCDRIAVIADGCVQAVGTPAELRRRADGRRELGRNPAGWNPAGPGEQPRAHL